MDLLKDERRKKKYTIISLMLFNTAPSRHLLSEMLRFSPCLFKAPLSKGPVCSDWSAALVKNQSERSGTKVNQTAHSLLYKCH